MKKAILAVLIVVATLASCDDEATNDPALDANLRVEGAQFHRGASPDEQSGPAVETVSLSPVVRSGASGRKCSGAVDARATAVALTLEGDPGYWIVPAGPPDIAAPGFPTFAATLGFSSALPSGQRMFIARAVDAQGHFGAPLARPLDVTMPARPTGKFVIALSWDDDADLDLHVVDPNGVEIWKRNINSYEPPPPGAAPEPPNTPHVGGTLDFDSNASCVPDALHAENVVYTSAPPRGHYVARVDTFSLCTELSARWRVEAFLEGVSVGASEGLSTEFDTRFSHDRGAGVLALEIDVP